MKGNQVRKQRIRFNSNLSITMYDNEQRLFQENDRLHRLVQRQGQVIANQVKQIQQMQVTIQIMQQALSTNKIADGKTKGKCNNNKDMSPRGTESKVQDK